MKITRDVLEAMAAIAAREQRQYTETIGEAAWGMADKTMDRIVLAWSKELRRVGFDVDHPIRALTGAEKDSILSKRLVTGVVINSEILAAALGSHVGHPVGFASDPFIWDGEGALVVEAAGRTSLALLDMLGVNAE